MWVYQWRNPFTDCVEKGDAKAYIKVRKQCHIDDRKNGRYKLFDTKTFALRSSVVVLSRP